MSLVGPVAVPDVVDQPGHLQLPVVGTDPGQLERTLQAVVELAQPLGLLRRVRRQRLQQLEQLGERHVTPPRDTAHPAVVVQHVAERTVGVPGPPRQHGLRLLEDDAGVGDLGAPRRVGGEVEAAPLPLPILDVGHRLGAQHGQVHRLQAPVPRPGVRTAVDVLPAPVVLPVRGVAPPRRTLPPQEGGERHAVALRRDLDVDGLADGGEHVDVLRELADDVSVGLAVAGVTHDPQDVVARLEGTTLVELALVPELFAVVGGDDDDRVVPHPQHPHGVEHAPQLGVDVGDHPQVLRLEHPQLVILHRRPQVGQPPAERHLPLGRGQCARHCLGVVAARPVPGGGVGRVGAQVAGVREPRSGLAMEPGDDGVAQEGGHAVLGGTVGFGGQGGVAAGGHVVAEPSEPRPPPVLLVGQVQLQVEAGEEALVRPQPGVVGPRRRPGVDPLIGVPEHGGGVAGPARRPGHVVEAEVEGRAVAHHTVVELVRPCVETGPPRSARGRLAVVPGEAHPLARQPVEIGGLHHRVPGTRQAIASELVEGHEENVHGCDPVPPSWRRPLSARRPMVPRAPSRLQPRPPVIGADASPRAAHRLAGPGRPPSPTNPSTCARAPRHRAAPRPAPPVPVAAARRDGSSGRAAPTPGARSWGPARRVRTGPGGPAAARSGGRGPGDGGRGTRPGPGGRDGCRRPPRGRAP